METVETHQDLKTSKLEGVDVLQLKSTWNHFSRRRKSIQIDLILSLNPKSTNILGMEFRIRNKINKSAAIDERH